MDYLADNVQLVIAIFDIKKTLFTQSKIDDEIYTELKNNLSDEFAELRKQLLEDFK